MRFLVVLSVILSVSTLCICKPDADSDLLKSIYKLAESWETPKEAPKTEEKSTNNAKCSQYRPVYVGEAAYRMTKAWESEQIKMGCAVPAFNMDDPITARLVNRMYADQTKKDSKKQQKQKDSHEQKSEEVKQDDSDNKGVKEEARSADDVDKEMPEFAAKFEERRSNGWAKRGIMEEMMGGDVPSMMKPAKRSSEVECAVYRPVYVGESAGLMAEKWELEQKVIGCTDLPEFVHGDDITEKLIAKMQEQQSKLTSAQKKAVAAEVEKKLGPSTS